MNIAQIPRFHENEMKTLYSREEKKHSSMKIEQKTLKESKRHWEKNIVGRKRGTRAQILTKWDKSSRSLYTKHDSEIGPLGQLDPETVDKRHRRVHGRQLLDLVRRQGGTGNVDVSDVGQGQGTAGQGSRGELGRTGDGQHLELERHVGHERSDARGPESGATLYVEVPEQGGDLDRHHGRQAFVREASSRQV